MNAEMAGGLIFSGGSVPAFWDGLGIMSLVKSMGLLAEETFQDATPVLTGCRPVYNCGIKRETARITSDQACSMCHCLLSLRRLAIELLLGGWGLLH